MGQKCFFKHMFFFKRHYRKGQPLRNLNDICDHAGPGAVATTGAFGCIDIARLFAGLNLVISDVSGYLVHLAI